MQRPAVDTPTTPARRPLPRGFWPIWTTVALDLIGFGIVVPILAIYAKRFGASGLTIGLLFTSFSLAQFLFAPVLGRLSDRIGRKPVILLSLLGTAAGSFLTGAAGTLWVLFAGRIVDGASGASQAVAQAAAADLAEPSERPRLMGLIGAAFGVGFVVGPAIGGLASRGGPHVPFYVAGCLALINAVAAWRRVPETLPAAQRTARHTALHTAQHTAQHTPPPAPGPATPAPRRALNLDLRRLAIVGLVTTAAFTAFESTFTLLGQRRFGLTEGGASVVFLGIGLLLVLIQGGIYHRLVGRAGAKPVYLVGLVVLTVGLLVTAGATRWVVLIGALVLLTVGQGLASPSLTSLVTEHAPPRQRGQAMGFQQSAYSVGRIVGPPGAGWLFDHAGTWVPLTVAAGLCLAVLVPAIGIAPTGEPAAAEPVSAAASGELADATGPHSDPISGRGG